MKTSPAKSQLNLPPTLLQSSEQEGASLRISEPVSVDAAALLNLEHEALVLRKAEHDTMTVDEAIRVSSMLVAEALKNAKINYKAAAHLTGVSDSLAQKWCSPDQRESPSLVQQLRLGVRFNYELHKAINRHERFGFGRRALGEMLSAAGMLALAVER
jgi:hypothetical protein